MIELLRGIVLSIMAFGSFVFVMGVFWGDIKLSIVWFFVLAAAIVLGILLAGMALYMRIMSDDEHEVENYYPDDSDNNNPPPRKPTPPPAPKPDNGIRIRHDENRIVDDLIGQFERNMKQKVRARK